MLRTAFAVALCASALLAGEKDILVVTAQPADYLLGAGGTLAGFARDGWSITVVQVTNDEKMSLASGPAETRLANNAAAERAARTIGARQVLNLGHKAGELGYLASTELRNEIFTLIRFHRPRIIVIPDPYVHYIANRDSHYAGKMAEEAWGYSGGGTFNPELTHAGLPGYSAPEIYYYAPGRPYRAGEGGDERAEFRGRDISATFDRKVEALLALDNWSAVLAARTHAAPAAAVRAYAEELAATIGKRHGFRYGEEFNYVGPGSSLQEHIREKAKSRP